MGLSEHSIGTKKHMCQKIQTNYKIRKSFDDAVDLTRLDASGTSCFKYKSAQLTAQKCQIANKLGAKSTSTIKHFCPESAQ